MYKFAEGSLFCFSVKNWEAVKLCKCVNEPLCCSNSPVPSLKGPQLLCKLPTSIVPLSAGLYFTLLLLDVNTAQKKSHCTAGAQEKSRQSCIGDYACSEPCGSLDTFGVSDPAAKSLCNVSPKPATYAYCELPIPSLATTHGLEIGTKLSTDLVKRL